MTLGVLHGIATALYGTEEKSTLSLTTLISTDKDNIFINATRKIELDPRRPKEMRDGFQQVLSEICATEPQCVNYQGQLAQLPLKVVYGVPEVHPDVYEQAIRNAFPGMLNTVSSRDVNDLLEKLFLIYFGKYGCHKSHIELHGYNLFLSHENAFALPITEDTVRTSEMLDPLIEAAKNGDENAINFLNHYVTEAAIIYVADLQERGIEPPRFIQYGLPKPEYQNCSRYTFLEWFDLRDVFTRTIMKYAGASYNICVKTPNDKPNPAFADIAATHIADQWDVLNVRNQGGYVVAK